MFKQFLGQHRCVIFFRGKGLHIFCLTILKIQPLLSSFKFLIIYIMRYEITLQHAEYMRKNPTRHEKMFRDILRRAGLMFRAQHLFDINGVYFIADFVLFKKAKDGPLLYYVIEIDGKSHSGSRNKLKDVSRTLLLSTCRAQVIRFKNSQVEKEPDKVLAEILALNTQKGREYFSKKRTTREQKIINEKNNPFEIKVNLDLKPEKLKQKMEVHRKRANKEGITNAERNREYAAFSKYYNELKRYANRAQGVRKISQNG